MNFCSITDAWGLDSVRNFETFEDVFQKDKEKNKTNQINYQNNIKKPNYNFNYDCNTHYNHVLHCSTCYNKLKEHFQPLIIRRFDSLIENNKDMVTLILTGIFIILFIKLINNITKN